jgi:hypothetical protein
MSRAIPFAVPNTHVLRVTRVNTVSVRVYSRDAAVFAASHTGGAAGVQLWDGSAWKTAANANAAAGAPFVVAQFASPSPTVGMPVRVTSPVSGWELVGGIPLGGYEGVLENP